MIRHLLSRIGCLLLIVGIVVLFIGVAALQSEQPSLKPLALGTGFLLIGFLFWRRKKPKKRQNTRFSLFRKRNRRNKEKNDDGWETHYYD
jgi:uncharacterized membrane protein YfcA